MLYPYQIQKPLLTEANNFVYRKGRSIKQSTMLFFELTKFIFIRENTKKGKAPKINCIRQKKPSKIAFRLRHFLLFNKRNKRKQLKFNKVYILSLFFLSKEII